MSRRALLAGAVVLVLGLAGLIWSWWPSDNATSGQPRFVVTNAYLRPPAPPTDAVALYLVIRNDSGVSDTLASVTVPFGSMAMVHEVVDGIMREMPGGLPIPAHSSVALEPGKYHIMVTGLSEKLVPGTTQPITLSFVKAGDLTVTARVIALTAPQPGG